ncbi:prolipoprotein diacylglyceryl transferase [Pedobacter yulinensis]|uniref:Phosphatidylglycerol--prolipoprotein diacylglyceryl transferase n=1 Tax=Pedobacter yulinensis TaxID=2126353 RepID=A0A2T3HQE5_9SPHI|nr:prolipoprotein diacylglyceryl transferase [Pedobacter yulinensis]PST84607.1 prolipoprotein diacylglyceryl transferase [Pedobacter yulinensis]
MTAYIHWNPSPELIDLGFIAIQWYSLLFALGFVFSFRILKGEFKKDGYPVLVLEKLTVYVVLATLIGARLGHCLFYDWAYYKDHLLEIFLPVEFQPSFRFTGFRGLASHGGALGIFIALILFARKFKVPFLWLLDKMALVVPLAGACIRFGNLMNSEIIGKPAELPWAFIFEKVDRVPRHPGQLYEALCYLVLFAVMTLLNRKGKSKPGLLFGVFIASLFLIRFFIEFLKENQSAFEEGMQLNMGQLLSIPFILLGIFFVLRPVRKT